MKELEDSIIQKITAASQEIKVSGTEPGVEITQGLSAAVDDTVRNSVASGHDLEAVCKAILTAVFRSNRAVALEAHKTIRLILSQVIQSVSLHQGDIDQAVKGLLEGITDSAREHGLNPEEALIVAKEDIDAVKAGIPP